MSAVTSCDAFAALKFGIFEYGELDDPYHLSLCICFLIALKCFIVSSITGNVSQVDKLWSISPMIYAWIAVTDARTFLMAVLVTVWGIRLTWNFNRRGGYMWPCVWRGEEDYRWPALRSGTIPFFGLLSQPVPWAIFNLVFISLYQNLLLLLITAPSLVAWSAARSPACIDSLPAPPLDMMGLDGLATLLFLFFVFVESLADNQQWAFQTEKYRRKISGLALSGDYIDGFCQSGLFALVRKPNYAAEQSIWVSFYLFSVASLRGRLVNWTLTGPFLLILLFQGSGWLTELLTERRYPSYSEYKRKVPRYIPSLPHLFRVYMLQGGGKKKSN